MNEEPISPTSPSARFETEDALFDALRKADRSESLGRSAAGLAKELNELLALILGAVDAAKRSDHAALGEAEQACIAAREVTRRLLAMGRGADSARSLAHPRELLLEAAKDAGAGSPVEIAVDVAEGAALVHVDRGQIVQAFRNLIENSIEAMPPSPHRSRVQVRAANASLPQGRVEGLPAGDYVEFEIRDNAAGIPAGDLERIWNPYFTTKRHRCGLGLPTALAIVRRHAGQIGVDSDPGVGTVFTIFLPQAPSGDEPVAHRAPSERFRTGRVLVMDDEPKIAALTDSMLLSLDYKCDLARSGEEAISWYRRYLDVGRPYDAALIELDIVGRMGGLETLDELRALDPEVRAIAVHTGDEEDSRRLMEQGFCGCLLKPYRTADLGKVLKAVLG